MKSHVLKALEKTPNNNRTLKFHLEFNFQQFSRKKNGIVLG